MYGLVPRPENCAEKNGKLARGIVTKKMRRNSGKLRQNYLYFTVQFLSKVIAMKTQQTSTCPYRLVLPAGKLCQKKWQTYAGNCYRKCALIPGDCAKIVSMFYSGSLIKNDHGE